MKNEKGQVSYDMFKNAFKHYLFLMFFVVILCLCMFVLKQLIFLVNQGQSFSIDREIFRAIKPQEIHNSL